MVLLFLIILFLFLYDLYRNKQDNAFIIAAFLFLVIFYNFDNHSLHPDIEPYQDVFYSMYNTYEKSMGNYNWEYGYGLFNYVVYNLVPNFNFFYFLYSIIIISGGLITIYRYSENTFFTFGLYLTGIFFSLFLMRQYIAISICLLTIPYILNRKLIPFILLTSLAMLFHISSIIWLLAYFIYLLPMNKKGMLYLFGVIIGLAVVAPLLFETLLEFEYFWKLSAYSLDEAEKFTWKNFLISSFVLVYFLFMIRHEFFQLEGAIKLFFLLYCVSICFDFINMIGTSFTAFYRLKLFFSFSSIYLITYATLRIENKDIKVLSILFFIVLNVYLAYRSIQSQGGLEFIL